MWWINRFGSVTGPYNDAQIRKLVNNHQLTRLHKISQNKVDWTRVDQSDFWSQSSKLTEEMPLPELVIPTPQPIVDAPPVLSPVGVPIRTSIASSHTRRGFLDVLSSNLQLTAIIAASILIIFATIICSFVISSSRDSSVEKQIADLQKSATSDVGASADSGTTSKQEVTESTDSDANRSGGIEFDDIKKKVVLVKTKEGSGTGFLVMMDGRRYLVTNEHVVRSGDPAEARLVDGTRISLGAMSIAKDRDLVRYEVDHKGEYFELSSAVPNNGDKIWVFGNSSGDGVITSLKGEVTGVGNMYLKVDAEFVGGNSGSPIVNSKGEVLAVASFIRRGSEGHDWTTKGTEFDEARRFAVRFTHVEWNRIEADRFMLESRKLEAMRVYWLLLREYLICEDVSEKDYESLKLVQKDIDRRRFGAEDYGFHEMLMEISKAYSGQGKSWSKWRQLLKAREAVIKELDAAVDSGELTLTNAQKALSEYDLKNEIDGRWAKVKEKHREFIAKKKEGLIMARSFLRDEPWQNPRMQNGYGEGQDSGSVDWYLEAIQYFLDQNAQKLKDLNKALRSLEGDDDEE